jgi:hypothetical protein
MSGGFAIGVFYTATHSGLVGFVVMYFCYNTATFSRLIGFVVMYLLQYRNPFWVEKVITDVILTAWDFTDRLNPKWVLAIVAITFLK